MTTPRASSGVSTLAAELKQRADALRSAVTSFFANLKAA